MTTSNRAPVEPGGTIRVLCDTTDNQRITADVTAEEVDLLRCGCWRVRTQRPGPRMDGVRGYTYKGMEVIFQRCGQSHEEILQDDPPPAPIVIQRTA